MIAINPRRRFSLALSALRHRNYRLYWFGQLASVLAQNMEFVAQSWLVIELTNSPLLLGLTGLSQAIPTITLTLVGGVIADRADRRRIMIAAQSTVALLYLILATLIFAKQVALWHVMTIAFISGAVRAFDRPSRMALLPHMVPKEDIPNAVAIGGTVWQLCKLTGPALAGILIYLFGVAVTYYLCFAASLSAVTLWLFIRLQHQPTAASRGGMLQQMKDGVNFIRHNELYLTFIGLTFFNSIFGMSYVILMPIFARDILHVGSRGFGFLQSAAGAGALVGALMAAVFSHTGRQVLQTALGATLFGIFLMLFALSPIYSLSLSLVFALGMTSQFYMTSVNQTLQLHLPEQLRGRVMGISGLAWEVTPIGGIFAGTIAEFAGAPIAVLIGGALVAGTALRIVMSKAKMQRLEPQHDGNGGTIRAEVEADG
ncbi:MAG: MFS transporter [Deltaproteobacteria bacterium]|nr:MFS transporter [Deltaproteobacteria bacterium]